MLHDFLILEYYFGSVESAQNLEEVLQKYGKTRIKKAIHDGHLQVRQGQFDSQKRHAFCSLTERGRLEAQKQSEMHGLCT